MYKWCRYLLLAGILFFILPLQAQRLGLLPPKTRWHQLQHDSLTIIYPDGLDNKAARIATLMLRLASKDPIVSNGRYAPISVVLQPESNVSNGYVGLAPYVSEIYLQPAENPFELGSLPWEDLLAIHEYRHVQQVNAINTSFSHLIKAVFGELAFNAMLGLATTNWMREGDAVWMETKHTMQGRGRLSRFTLPFRERIRTEKPWGYYKLRNGSYKIWVPDHYPLGYLMMQYGNHVFGEDTWDTIYQLTARISPVYDPNSGVIKKFYGKSNRNLYLGAMDYFGKEWKEEEQEDVIYPTIPITNKNERASFYDMNFPDVSEEGDVYSMITSFDSTYAIYKFGSDGHQDKIKRVGTQLDPYFDQRQSQIVWTEIRMDPRWVRKNKNVIVLYDEISRIKKDILPEKGYFMPRLNADATKIVALHTDLLGNHNLRLIDVNTAEVTAELPNPDNFYLAYPLWSDDAEYIIATARDTEGRMALVKQHIVTGVITRITHFSYYVLGRPVESGPWIFLTTNLKNLDQVFAVDQSEGIFYQVSFGNRAHYDPAWDSVQKNIICTEYTNTGKKLVRLPGEPAKWRMTNLDGRVKSIDGASAEDVLTAPSKDHDFEVSQYSPWKKLINFHSLRLKVNDPDYAIELLSDNILNSMSLATGFQYDRNNESYGPYVNVRMGMWYPEVLLGYSNLRQQLFDNNGGEYNSVSNEFYTGVSLPLLFTPGVYNQVLNAATTFNGGINRLTQKPDLKQDLRYYYMNHRLLFSNAKLRSHRQYLPSFGQLLDVSYSYNVGVEKIKQLYGITQFALPSIKPSHYVLITGEYLSQQTGDDHIQLSSRYQGPRGFDIPDGENNYNVSLTYGFPLLYPDVGFGNVAYVRRIRLQPFFDYGFTNYEAIGDQNLASTGAELLLDFQFASITLGFRFTTLLQGYHESDFVFEFFLPSLRF